MTSSMNDPKVQQDFIEAGGAHLFYLEQFGASCGANVLGVPVIQAMNYDVIQMLNHHFLTAYIGELEKKEQVSA